MSDEKDSTLSSDELAKLLAATDYVNEESIDTRYHIHLETRSAAFFLVIEGRMCQPTPEEFHDRVSAIFDQAPIKGTIIDLSKCTYLSSAGLSTLVRIFGSASKRGHQIVMLCPNERIWKVICILRLESIFLKVEDETMALRFLEEQRRNGSSDRKPTVDSSNT